MASVSDETNLEVRLPHDHKMLIEEAAELSGQTVDSFIVSTVVEAARRAVDANQRIRLSDRDRDRFLELLENPPEPNDRLKQAAQWHKEHIVR